MRRTALLAALARHVAKLNEEATDDTALTALNIDLLHEATGTVEPAGRSVRQGKW